jgi:putative ABC transport system permease protein
VSRRGGRLTGWLVGWRLALRLARREALRTRARSLLALAMIALPVLAVTAADVVISTSQVSPVESLDRRLGAAGAEIRVLQGSARVFQGVDPDHAIPSNRAADGPPATLDDVRRVLGGTGPTLTRRQGGVQFETAEGVGSAEAVEVDLTDPLARGLARLTSGRLPRTADEVVVNRALAARGPAVGDSLRLVPPADSPADGPTAPEPTIVGIAESTSVRDLPAAFGRIGSLGLPAGEESWLVAGTVTWAEVRDLNRIGATVLSRHVVEHPPAPDEIPARVRAMDPGSSDSLVAVVVLIVVMALLEVVLLAGPAFAVGARQQSRQLALMASTGATPAQTRRVVLAGGVVLGGVAAVAGVLLGIGAGALLLPLVQLRSGSWFGPFEVPWPHLVVVAGFGLFSALLAAVVPAWLASRQDVVAVLAGRRGDRPPSRRSPALGVALLGVAVAMAAYGARHVSNLFIAGSAIVAVLAMILLVPLAVVVLARCGGRLPLVLRYAVRDAARHRTRTVPAVAAVAATVAGVVALGIATSSDEAENRERYLPSVTAGTGVVTTNQSGDADWPALEQVVRREAPGATVASLRGVQEDYESAGFYAELQPLRPPRSLLDSYGSALGSGLLVSDGPVPSGLVGLADELVPTVERALARGEAVAFTNTRSGAPTEEDLRLEVVRFSGDDDPEGDTTKTRVPGLVVPLDFSQGGPAAILPSRTAREAGLPVGTVGLALTGTTITEQQETDLSEALTAVQPAASFTVERGYVTDEGVLIVQLVLAALGAVLMLGGTLTATFLALSDARPDLATLSAVGASPRTRRGVAAAYALVIGLVGAVLGAVVGFVPGIAVAYPLTVVGGDTCTVQGSGWCESTGVGTGPFLDVPWLMIAGLVLALPLLTALVVGLAARSRLPLVARLG